MLWERHKEAQRRPRLSVLFACVSHPDHTGERNDLTWSSICLRDMSPERHLLNTFSNNLSNSAPATSVTPKPGGGTLEVVDRVGPWLAVATAVLYLSFEAEVEVVRGGEVGTADDCPADLETLAGLLLGVHGLGLCICTGL